LFNLEIAMLDRLWTLMRARAHSAGETITDAHALEILEQQIRDAADGVREAARQLATLMASEMQDRRALDAARTRLAKHERYALAALARDEEALARDLAASIGGDERERDQLTDRVAETVAAITRLRGTIATAEQRIATLRRELAAARARAALRRTNSRIAQRCDGAASALDQAEATLARIRERDAQSADYEAAAEILRREADGTSLHESLYAAGIADPPAYSVEAVLLRLRAIPPSPIAAT
jgi:phage shock protein A